MTRTRRFGLPSIIAYLRVSTPEQADSRAGLEAQRAPILAEAARRGWAELEFIEDAASRPDRCDARDWRTR